MHRKVVNLFYQLYWSIRGYFQAEKALCVIAVLALCSVVLHWQSQTKSRRFSREYGNYGFSKPQPRPKAYVPECFVNWRNRFLAVQKETDSLGIVRGVFLGNDWFIPKSVRETFLDSGLYHLLAASGFNCWMVALMLGFLGRIPLVLLFPYLPSVVGIRLKQWLPKVSELAGAWLFWLWSDQSPPITRAAYFISIRFVIYCLCVSTNVFRLIFIQYLVTLIIVPAFLWNTSFQLSFFCLFGIGIVTSLFEKVEDPLLEKLSQYGSKKVWRFFILNTVTSFGACLGVLPVSWFAFGRISFTSVFTNILTIPWINFMIMPVSLIQMLLLPLGISVLDQKLALFLGFVAELFYNFLETCMKFIPLLNYED